MLLLTVVGLETIFSTFETFFTSGKIQIVWWMIYKILSNYLKFINIFKTHFLLPLSQSLSIFAFMQFLLHSEIMNELGATFSLVVYGYITHVEVGYLALLFLAYAISNTACFFFHILMHLFKKKERKKIKLLIIDEVLDTLKLLFGVKIMIYLCFLSYYLFVFQNIGTMLHPFIVIISLCSLINAFCRGYYKSHVWSKLLPTILI